MSTEPFAAPHRPWPGEHVRLGDVTVHVRRTPATVDGAEPALYLHGLGGSALNWTDFAAAMAHRFAGEAIDLPGFGLSGPPPRGGYRQAALAAHVARWIEHAGTAPVHMVGNSFGGAVALRVAALRPDLVRSLVLVSAAMPVGAVRLRHGRMFAVLVPPVNLLARRLFAGASAEVLTGGALEAGFADVTRLSPTRRAEMVAEGAEWKRAPWAYEAFAGSLRGLAAAYLAPGRRSMWSLARQVRVPTLVVTGDRDDLVLPRLARRTAQLVPDATLLLLDGVGHTAHMEVPGILAHAMSEWLNRDTGDFTSEERSYYRGKTV